MIWVTLYYLPILDEVANPVVGNGGQSHFHGGGNRYEVFTVQPICLPPEALPQGQGQGMALVIVNGTTENLIFTNGLLFIMTKSAILVVLSIIIGLKWEIYGYFIKDVTPGCCLL